MARTCVGRMSCFRGLTGILLLLQLPLLPAYVEDCQAIPPTGHEILARHDRLLESPELLSTSAKASNEVGWGALSEVGHWSNENHTRVIIQLTREVEFDQRILFKPDRIYFDLHNAVMKSNWHGKTYAVNSFFIRRVRIARNRPGVIRVVLDLEQLKKYTVFALHNPFRIVIDSQEDTGNKTMDSAILANLIYSDVNTRGMEAFSVRTLENLGLVSPMSVGRENPPLIRYLQLIREAAARHHVDQYLVQAIVAVESRYNPSAVSPKGCVGLMQLHPDTAERFGVRDPFNPAENIEGGTKYLKFLMGEFKGDLQLVLAAYNAGEQAVARYNGIPPYQETRDYVRKVTTVYYTLDSTQTTSTPQ